MSERMPPLDRFWTSIERTHSCWNWTGRINAKGYGVLKVLGRTCGAHRFAYEIHNGAIPEGMMIRHSCDNRRCVNPEHLEPGTHADNMRDMTDRGRAHRWGGTRLGSKNPHSKLKEDEVAEIKRLLREGVRSKPSIAEQFKISLPNIYQIADGATWKQVKTGGENV